jgi:hypothetical protein
MKPFLDELKTVMSGELILVQRIFVYLAISSVQFVACLRSSKRKSGPNPLNPYRNTPIQFG